MKRRQGRPRLESNQRPPAYKAGALPTEGDYPVDKPNMTRFQQEDPLDSQWFVNRIIAVYGDFVCQLRNGDAHAHNHALNFHVCGYIPR